MPLDVAHCEFLHNPACFLNQISLGEQTTPCLYTHNILYITVTQKYCILVQDMHRTDWVLNLALPFTRIMRPGKLLIFTEPKGKKSLEKTQIIPYVSQGFCED